MTRISTLTLLMAFGISAAAYAQPMAAGGAHSASAPSQPANSAPANPSPAANTGGGNAWQDMHSDSRTVETDDAKIRELDKKRDEALRANNPQAAQQYQAQIDKLRAQRHTMKEDIHKDKQAIQQHKLSEEEKCARDPVCAKRKRAEAVGRELVAYRQRLGADEAAAQRISQDKAEIAKREQELQQLH